LLACSKCKIERRELARGQNPTLKKFVAAAFQIWAPLTVQLDLMDGVATLLDGMTNDDWHALLAYSERPPGIRPSARQRFALGKTKTPETASPRAAAFVMSKVVPKDSYALWKKYLLDYDGDDREVHKAAVRAVLCKCEKMPAHWSSALEVISKAYDAGVSYQVYRPERTRGDLNVPPDVAKQICSEPESYPLWLVSMAESAIAAETGSAAIPVTKIAARDEWFAGT
jgi:hypothetical protein